MAENIASCSGTVNTSDYESPLNIEKSRVCNRIIGMLNESENLWGHWALEQQELHRLFREQMNVSDKFTQYNLIWRHRVRDLESNLISRIRIEELREQYRALLQELEDFERNSDRGSSIIKEFIRKMRTHIGRLKENFRLAINANNMDDLMAVQVPNLDWTLEIPNPEIYALAEEWDNLQLERAVTQILHELMDIITD